MSIALVQTSSGKGATNSTVVASRTWTTGNVVVLSCVTANGSIAVNSITASGGAIFAGVLTAAVRNSSPGHEWWLVRINTGFTGTLTVAWSGSDNNIVLAAEFSGVTSVGVGNSSAPTSTANPSISLSAFSQTSGAPWTVAGFVVNNVTDPTSGTGNLRISDNQSTISAALVDNTTTTCAVTHASGNWGIGIVELYDGGTDYGNGAYSLAGTGTNGYLAGYNDFEFGVSLTTGSNPDGYELNSASVITDNVGSGAANLRAGVYDNTADPNKARLADSGSIAFGTAAGTGAACVHVASFTRITLQPNTTYWIAWNNDTALLAYRLDDTTSTFTGTVAFYAASAFGAPPNPWGSRTEEDSGPHMWVHVTAITRGIAGPRLGQWGRDQGYFYSRPGRI